MQAYALSNGEVNAIKALIQNFPALRTATPPWLEDGSLACTTPVFYGLTCTDEPESHITKLYDTNIDFHSQNLTVCSG